jgi:hypothetical protein
MPYVSQNARDDLDHGGIPTSVGELNYAITKLLWGYFQREGAGYQAVNDCLGACDGAKLEFYRRIAVPYEDQKIQKNGDVYV